MVTGCERIDDREVLRGCVPNYLVDGEVGRDTGIDVGCFMRGEHPGVKPAPQLDLFRCDASGRSSAARLPPAPPAGLG